MPIAHLTQEGKWVIVTNFNIIRSQGVGGSRSRLAERSRQVFDVWTENGWSEQRMMARIFSSKEEAEKFLGEHPELL